jgi:hypothetical protein
MPHCRTTVQTDRHRQKSQPHILAHLVLPDTQANASQNQKSHFLANASSINRILQQCI